MSWKCNCEVDVQWPRHLLSNANALCYFWFGFTCNSWLSEGVGVAIIYQYMMYRWMILHVIVFQTKTIPSKTMLYFGKLCVSAMMTLSQKNITIHIWNHRVVKVYMFERLPQKNNKSGCPKLPNCEHLRDVWMDVSQNTRTICIGIVFFWDNCTIPFHRWWTCSFCFLNILMMSTPVGAIYWHTCSHNIF